MTPEKKVELKDWIVAMLSYAKEYLTSSLEHYDEWSHKDDELHKEAVAWLDSLQG